MESSKFYVCNQHQSLILRSMGEQNIYLIKTRDRTLHQIKGDIDKLIKVAEKSLTLTFIITTSLGAEEDIAPMFAKAPTNCILPNGWKY